MNQSFTQEQIDLIKNTIAKGATNDELALFMATCKKTGLDPFSRQIYMIERKFQENGEWRKKMEVQSSINGLRVVAERSGKYLGQEGPFWCGEDAKWMDVWLSDKQPSASKVGIKKLGSNGEVEIVWGVATWRSYAQTKKDGSPMFMWQKMGDVLLAKCAEANGLRKAFPNDLSGVVAHEEMLQSTNDVKTISESKARAIEARIEPKQVSVEKIENLPKNNENTPTGYIFKTGGARKNKMLRSFGLDALINMMDWFDAEKAKDRQFTEDELEDFEMIKLHCINVF